MASGLSATQLILDALRPHQTPTTWESDFIRLQADWDDLAVRAIVLGLAPQFHIRLSHWGLEIGARAAVKLGAAYQAQARRNEAIFAQLSEALIACTER